MAQGGGMARGEADSELRRLQHWMLELITDPRSGEGEEVERVILPSRQLSGVQRMEIYQRMYWLRLVDVLGKDFPAVKELLGAADFDRVAREYLTAHPSAHFSLNVLGAGFPAFLASEAGELPHREFTAELARLEWTIQVVFDEEHAEPVEEDALADVPPGAWETARLRTVPALRLLAFRHPVNAALNSQRAGKGVAPTAPVPQEPSHVVVYRKDDQVWRNDLSEGQFAVLGALQRGATLGEALASAAALPEIAFETLQSSVGSWFQEWASERLFRAVELSGG